MRRQPTSSARTNWWHQFTFVRKARDQEEAGEHIDALIDAAEAAGFKSEGGVSTPDDDKLTSYGAEEIAAALSEAVRECEREPRTSLWESFWDRLTFGEGGPSMPDGGDDA
jgi:hypothetical protein